MSAHPTVLAGVAERVGQAQEGPPTQAPFVVDGASRPFDIAVDLAAFMPSDRRRALARGAVLPDRSDGTALFADLSGFVRLSEALAQAYGPRQGAEELTAALDRVFAALVAEVDRTDGSVIGFSGDAMTAWFDGDAGPRAIVAAIAMRDVVAGMEPIAIPAGSPIRLGIKVALVSGPVRRVLVGDPLIRRFDVIAGPTLDRLALAAEVPARGEIVVDADLVDQLGTALRIGEQRALNGQRYAVVSGWEAADPGVLAEHQVGHGVGSERGTGGEADPVPIGHDEQELRGLLPGPVFERLRAGGEALLAELRPAVAVFVRLGGLDFEHRASAERLDAFVRWAEQVIASHGGTVVDLTIGEKGSFLCVVFGAPVAHDDDPLRAVTAAGILRDPPGAISLGEPVRIGIARGRMCVGIFGGPTRRSYGVQGIDVSVAARLMQRAEGGQVILSERVVRAIAGRIDTRPLGDVAVKGLAQPLAIFELAGASSGAPVVGGQDPGGEAGAAAARAAAVTAAQSRAGNALQPDMPLIGRATELAILERLLGEAEAGSTRAAVVRGEPGVGKSRLAAALGELAARRGVRILRGAANAVDGGLQYAAWRRVYATLLDLSSADPRAALERATSTFAERDRERLALLGAVLPGAPADTDATLLLDPAARMDETQRLLVELFLANRGQPPTLLIVDDVQWLDSASWTLLRRLSRASDRLLVVLTARSETGSAGPELDEFVATAEPEIIDLTPLPPGDGLSLIRQALGVEAIPDAVARFVAGRAEGHPLFTLELAYAMRDAGLVDIAGGRARLREGADLARFDFPESIEGLVSMRVDRLPPASQDALKVASVADGSFTAADLADGTGQDPAHLAAVLRRLVELDLVSPPDGGGAHTFRHALIRDAVYGRLLFAQRRRLHSRVAERLERTLAAWQSGGADGTHGEAARRAWTSEETASGSRNGGAAVPNATIAHHWDAAGEPARAVPHLEVAGEAAFRDGAFPEASRLLTRALRLTEAGDQGEPVGGRTPVDPSQSRAVEPLRRARWQWLAAQASYRLGELERSRALAETALGAFDRPLPTGKSRTIAAIGGQMARQLAHRLAPGRFVGRSREADRERLRFATRAYFNLAEVYYLASRREDSALAALRGLNLAEQLGPSRELVEAYGSIAIIAGLLGRHGIAERYGRLGLAAAAQIEDPFASALILHQVCLYRSGTGPAGPLLADFQTAIDGFREIGDKGRLRDCLGIAGVAAYIFGRTELAARWMRELLATHGEGERSLPGVWALTWLGASALHDGRPLDALDLLTRAGAAGLGSEGLDMTSIALHGLHARALRSVGRDDEASREADRTRALILETGGRPTGHPVLDGYAALAELALQDWDAATSAEARAGASHRTEEAIRFLASYRRTFPIGGPAYWRYKGEVALRRGDRRAAAQLFATAFKAAEQLDMWTEISAAHEGLGRVSAQAEANAAGMDVAEEEAGPRTPDEDLTGGEEEEAL